MCLTDICRAYFDDPEERARQNMAIANGVQAGARAMNPSASMPTAATPSCVNDYSCPSGQRCVKAVGQLDGTCMQAVNQYGVQTFSGPDPTSSGPGKRQCWGPAECPPGFMCSGGQCVK
jgi:hypothetical protein